MATGGRHAAGSADGDFTTFYVASHRTTVVQLYPMLGNLAEAEDVAQEAFLRALRHWSRIRHYDSPEAWVRRVAFNLAASRLRRASRAASALIRLGPPPAVPPISVDAVALAEALQHLPARQRASVVLFHMVGVPVEEIADLLSAPPATVRTWLVRGRRRLAHLLQEDADGDGTRTEVGLAQA